MDFFPSAAKQQASIVTDIQPKARKQSLLFSTEEAVKRKLLAKIILALALLFTLTLVQQLDAA